MEHHELYNEILKVRTEIQEKYPEMVKYLDEMPDTIPVIENREIDTVSLQKYLNSLRELVLKYKKSETNKK
jgi:hypothetical protein